VDLLLYEKAGHAQVLIGLAKPLRWSSPVAADTLGFINKNSCDKSWNHNNAARRPDAWSD
jgi:hypothetical protein